MGQTRRALAWDSQRQKDRAAGKYVREESDSRYHSARWARLSRAWRAAHPLCEECKRNGILTAGEVVDHITPVPVCQDFFDESNLQTLCRQCNHLKGQRDKKIIQAYRQGLDITQK